MLFRSSNLDDTNTYVNFEQNVPIVWDRVRDGLIDNASELGMERAMWRTTIRSPRPKNKKSGWANTNLKFYAASL